MALSGTFYNDFKTGYRLQVEWSASQNQAANQSTITVNFYLISLASYYTINSSDGKPTQMLSNGTSWVDTGEVNVTLSGNQKKFLVSHQSTVTHDSYGNWSKEIGGYINFQGVNLGGTSFNGVYCAQYITLDPIKRISTIASPVPPNFIAGATGLNWTINRYIPNATHALLLYVETTTPNSFELITSSPTTLGTSGTLPITLEHTTAIFNTLAGRASARTLLRVWTYVDGVKLDGGNDYLGTVTSPDSTQPSCPNFNIGDQVTINLPYQNGNFTHEIKWVFGTYERILTSNAGNSFVWDTSVDANAMYAQIPTAQSGNGGLVVTTYHQTAVVRTTKTQSGIIATIVNGQPTFSTIGYLDTNTTITAITGNSAWIVQNKSTLRARVLNVNKAVAKYGGSITKYIATFNGVSITVDTPFATDVIFDFGAVNVSTNQLLSITAYDARGFSKKVEVTVNVVPWSPPVVITTAARASGFLSGVAITLSGSISPAPVNGVNKNSLVAASTTWKTRPVGGSYGAATAWLGLVLTMPNYVANQVNTTLATTQAFEISVTVTDKFGSTEVVLTVPVGEPVIFFDKSRKVGIGRFPDGYSGGSARGLNVQGGANIKGGYFEIGSFSDASYGVGMLQSYYDANNASFRMFARNEAYTAVPLTVNLGTGGKLIGAEVNLTDDYKVNGNSLVPRGSIQAYAGSTAPSGWLLCQGQAVSRTTYSNLFDIIGTTYGAGDGSTTFNLPDLRGRVPVGLDSGQTEFDALNEKGGAKTHTLTTNEMPSHNHALSTNAGYYVFGGGAGNPAQGTGYGTRLSDINSASAGGGAAHNNLQPYIVMNFIIRY